MITYTITVDEEVFPFAPDTTVLLRNGAKGQWRLGYFAYRHCAVTGPISYVSINDGSYRQCIPYEGNEHLLNTRNAAEDPCTE